MAAVGLVPPTKWTRKSVTTGTLKLDAETGHRHTLLDVPITGLGARETVDVNVGGKYLFRVFSSYGDLRLTAKTGEVEDNVSGLGFLKKRIPELPLPYAAHDEDLVLEPSATYTILSGYYWDEEVPDAGRKDLEGGTQAAKYPLSLYATHSASLSSTGTYSFDTALNPTGYDALRDQDRVAGNKRYTIYAIGFGAAKNAGTKFTRLHIFDEATELFCEANEGLYVDIDNGNELLLDCVAGKIFKLKEPYVFLPYHRITLKADGIFDGTNTLAARSCVVALIGVGEVVG